MNDLDLIDSLNGEFDIIDIKHFKIKWRKSKKRKGIEIKIRNEYGYYEWFSYGEVINKHESFILTDGEEWFMKGIAFNIGKKPLSMQGYELLLEKIKEEDKNLKIKYPNLDNIFEEKITDLPLKKEDKFNSTLVKKRGEVILKSEGIVNDYLYVYEFDNKYYVEDDDGEMWECDTKDEAIEYLPDEWELIRSNGEIIAEQDWDSGGPGIGAGVVTLYHYKDKYYVEHDAGIDEYKSKEEAMKQL